jgi:hypothetical protein
MIIEFDESTPLHVIKELAVGLRLDDKHVELSIPELEDPGKVRFSIDFGQDPVSFVRLSFNDQPLDPEQTGQGEFDFDPMEFGHTLKIEFDTSAIPAAKQNDTPQWEGQINFQIDGDDEWSAFFIQVEKILGDETFEGVFAIDLGTTNSSIAYWEVKPEPDFLPLSPILLKEAQSIASAVNVLEVEPFKELAPNSYDVGQAAVGAARKANLHMSVKRGIGTKKRYVVAKGREIWQDADAQHMMTALGKKLLEDARSILGKNISEIVATSPPRWNAVQVGELRKVLKSLGFPADRIDMSTDEASAAGIYYLLYPLFERFGKRVALQEYAEKEFGRMRVAEGSYQFNMLSMDFGGGTTDLALIKVALDFKPQHLALDIDILDRGGRQDLGGDNLTLYLFRLLKRRLALALAHPQRLVDPATTDQAPSNPWIKQFRLDAQQGALLQRWDEVVEHLDDPELPRELWELVNGVFPTAWDFKDMPATYRKYKTPARRHFDWLWAQADELKRALCVDVTNEVKGQKVTEENLAEFDSRWLSPDLETFDRPVNLAECIPMAADDEDFRQDFLSISFGHITGFYRPCIQGLAEETARMEGRSLQPIVGQDGEQRQPIVDRVVLAGNGARIPVITALIHKDRDQGGLGVGHDQIKFDPVRAKLAVPIGACLRRIARKVEGFKVNIRLSRNLLPFDILLNMGTTSVKLFPSGQIDEFSFFQRTGVPEDLEVEYVTRLDEQDAGTENYKPYVLFKPKGESLALIDLNDESDLWQNLNQTYGLETIPECGDINPAFVEFDPKVGDLTAGSNVLAATTPEAVFATVGDRNFSHEQMLGILRNELVGPQKIAWIEGSFQDNPAEGTIVHRYYIDVTKQVYLVRHHWSDGKGLFLAETDEEALIELPSERNPFSGMH